MSTIEALVILSTNGAYTSEERKSIREDSFEAVSNVGGDYEEFYKWNRILAFMGLASIR